MAATRGFVAGALTLCLVTSAAIAQEKTSQNRKAAKAPQSIKGWGEVVDPAKDCEVKADGGKVTITVPGFLHDLNPDHGGMEAPRILQRIEGDFTCQVKVSGEFDPGKQAARPRELFPDKEAPPIRTSAFNSGGLLVWQDERNFIRLERNAWWVENLGRTACFLPLIEYVQRGEFQSTNPPVTYNEFFKGRSTWLRLERKKDTMTASYSHDGRGWVVAREFKVDLPEKLQVGVAVVNTAAKPLIVEFEGLSVTKK